MSKKKEIPDAFCPLPWMHFATHPNGNASLCCRINYADDEGFAESSDQTKMNLNRDGIDLIYNSDSYKRARLEMLSGKWPKACAGCAQAEKNGLQSKRLYELTQFPTDFDFLRQQTQVDGSLRKPSFDFIELRLGNKCNLKCRTCNPHSSIAWTVEYQKLESELAFVQKYPSIDVEWCESESFWNDLEKHLGAAPRFYINGGEPTLIEAHWKFLRRLVEQNRAGSIELMYNSNLTHLPEEALLLWQNFKRVEVWASIDGVKERNHYIRYPANWEKIESYTARLQNEGIKLSITHTISAMNFFYLDEMMTWATLRGLHVEFNFVYDPMFLSPQALPRKIRENIFSRLQFRYSSEQRHQLEVVTQTEDRPELWQNFLKYTRSLDHLRRQNFKQIFPELCSLLEESGYEIG